MKVFVSQPMKGKTEGGILSERGKALEELQERLGKFELIDTFFPDFNGNRLQFLGKSISEGACSCRCRSVYRGLAKL